MGDWLTYEAQFQTSASLHIWLFLDTCIVWKLNWEIYKNRRPGSVSWSLTQMVRSEDDKRYLQTITTPTPFFHPLQQLKPTWLYLSLDRLSISPPHLLHFTTIFAVFSRTFFTTSVSFTVFYKKLQHHHTTSRTARDFTHIPLGPFRACVPAARCVPFLLLIAC